MPEVASLPMNQLDWAFMGWFAQAYSLSREYARNLKNNRLTVFLQFINKIVPIRMSAHEELLGADFFEHDIRHPGVGVSRAVSVLKNYHRDIDETLEPKGFNKGKTNSITIWYVVMSCTFSLKLLDVTHVKNIAMQEGS